jgi:arginyl-tRNA synthetase
MNIKQQLQQGAAQALLAAFGKDIDPATLVVQPTSREHVGDYTVVLFPLLKLKLGSPDAIGDAIGNYLREKAGIVKQYEIVKGFLNLTLSDAFWLGFLKSFEANNAAVLTATAGNGQTVMVEFSSPNTNKPLHLGHLRNNFLGDSLCRILEAGGFKVVRACLVNDRGIHICKSMRAWQLDAAHATPESSGKKGDHLVGDYYVSFDREYKRQVNELVRQGATQEDAERRAPLMQDTQELLRKWEAGDAETRTLWQRMNQWVYDGFATTYQRMGIRFDKYYYESDTYLLGKDVVEEGLQKGVFYKKPDGSVWIDLTADGLDHKLVLRADGTSVYITQDLGTSDLKYADYHMQHSVYVIGNEQDYHMKVLILILKKLGRPYADGMFHLSYGMVELPSGKMKSREGTVVDADDLMEEVVRNAEAETRERGKVEGLADTDLKRLYETLGIGALKYYLLKVTPQKKMLFDPAESVSLQGDTGPFIQYSYARINSLLQKATQMGHTAALADAKPEADLQPAEKDLARRLYQWPDALADAIANYNPSSVAAYAVELAKDYNRFYYELPVLREEKEGILQLRLALSKLTAVTLKHSMGLLGIDVPERM